MEEGPYFVQSSSYPKLSVVADCRSFQESKRDEKIDERGLSARAEGQESEVREQRYNLLESCSFALFPMLYYPIHFTLDGKDIMKYSVLYLRDKL